MDYRTAAALSQNLAGIGDMFMQMNDPSNRARAALVGNQNRLLGAQVEGQNIDNYYAPGKNTASIFATNANGQQSLAAAGLSNAQTKGQGIQNQAGQALLDGYLRVPTTSYSYGADVGGPDEMQDSWTNKGYSATGKNLSPGVVAVNPSVHPIGTVLQGPDGQTYIAADKHGNKDPNVVDIFRDPNAYKAQSSTQNLRVVGREKIPYGTSAEQLAQMRSKYEQQAGLSNIFAGGGAEDLATGTAKMAALNAPDEMAARRAGLAITGSGFGQGEYFEPAMSDAFQGRGLKNNLDQEALRQQGAIATNAADNDSKARNAVFGAMTASGGTAAGSSTGTRSRVDTFDGAKEIGGATVARFALDGESVSQEDLPKAQAWATSVSTLTSQGVPFETAKAIADAHHGLPTMEDGWFSSPRQNYDAFNATSITPEQAAETAVRYGVGGAGGPGMDQILSAAQVFGFGGEPQLAAARPQPPAPAQPADPVPQTGTDKPEPKLSDEFKRRQSSGEAKAEKTRDADIKNLEARIKGLTSILKTGEITTGALAGSYGFQPQFTQSSTLNNDAYNTRLDELKSLESQLAALKSPKQPAASGVRRYNPETGTIE